MARVRSWPAQSCRGSVTEHAVTLAAFLIHRPSLAAGTGDANLRTHDRVRCTGLAGERVHRLDSARGLRFYTTGCGLRVPKTAGTLTAADVDCHHYGCRPRQEDTPDA